MIHPNHRSIRFPRAPTDGVWRLRCAASIALVVGLSGASWAQAPAGADFRVSTPDLFIQDFPYIAGDPAGNFYLAWEENYPTFAVRLRRFSRWGVLDPPVFLSGPRKDVPLYPRLALAPSGDVLAVWTLDHEERGPGRTFVEGFGRFFRPNLLPMQRPFKLGGPTLPGLLEFRRFVTDASFNPDGSFLVIWNESRFPPEIQSVVARAFDTSGRPAGTEFRLTEHAADNAGSPYLARDPVSGNTLAIWTSRDLDGSGYGVFGRLLRDDATFAGPVFQINTFTHENQIGAGVAADGLGHYFVVWRSFFQDFAEVAVYAQRLDADGRKVGPEFRVTDNPHLIGDHPAVSSDGLGHVAVTWDDGFDTFVKLYRSDGTQVGSRAFQVTSNPFADEVSPTVAFSPSGLLALAWIKNEGFDGIDANIYAQRFSASPGAEACIFRRGHFLCDVGRSGGAPEVDLAFGAAGDLPLLGDVDGDGRADPCVRHGRDFLCDRDHDGSVDFRLALGLPTDTPLLGDVDGDGKADLCLYRFESGGRGRFLCNTAHAGRRPNLEIQFGGAPGDLPLLGDLDHDGRADPCVYHAGSFLCDTAHDGGEAELSLAYSPIVGIPILVDVDGDGRVDPCLWGDGAFRCSTGRVPNFTLRFGGQQTGDIPLFANLDGL